MTDLSPRRAVRNTLVVFGGQVAARLLDLAAMLMIARAFGAAGFGRFSFAIAYVGYFAILTDLGFNMTFVQALVREPDRSRDLLADMLVIKFVLIGLGAGSAAVSILGLGYAVETVHLVWIMTLALLISPKLPSIRLVYEQVFQARLRMEIPIALRLVDGMLLVAFIYGFIRYGQPLQSIMIAYVLSHLPSLVFLFWISRRLVTPAPLFDRALMRRLFKNALPVALLGVFATITSRIDVLFLSFWRGETDIGLYAAAYRLTESLRLIPGAVITSLYPLMVQAYKHSAETLPSMLTCGIKPLVTLMLPVALGTTFLAGPLLSWFYTPAFTAAAPSLAVLIWTELAVVFTMPLSYALIAMDRRISVVALSFVMLITNLCMNVALIPRWGYIGASIATAATEGVGVAGYAFMMLRAVRWPCWQVVLPLLPGALCLLGWLLVVRSWPLPVAILSAGGVYALSLMATRGVTRAETLTLKNALFDRSWPSAPG